MTRQQFIPRAWQKPIISHVMHVPRCAVWAGMGLGKTTATLTSLDNMYLAGELTRPTLVCAPLRVAKNTWPAEADKWDHLHQIEVMPIVGDAKERTRALVRALKADNTSVYTLNYENLPWLEEALKAERVTWPFEHVVSDESTKLKGFRLRQGTQRAKALARVAHKHVAHFTELTGTPSPNGLIDLWGQVWFLDAGERLGRTFDSFKQRWFQAVPGGDGYTQVRPLPFAQAQIEEKLRDLCLSLDARDYFDLKEPICQTVYVDLPSKARSLYRDMEKEMFMQIGEHDVEAFSAATKTMKCLQIANGAAYVGEGSIEWKEIHDAKLDALESIVAEAAGMPVLVAYHFKSDLARLLRAFPQGRALDADPRTISEWNKGTVPLLFAHPASAGHGLNLQDGGNIIVIFGHWWDLEQYQQIIERIGPTRQMQSGHNRPVFIYHIVARDTVDEIVMDRRESKREVQDLLLEAMKRRTT
jgi:SNF2 family DNA or RNA helicase